MNLNITDRQRAGFVGIFILLAYSMLTYTLTGNKGLGVFTDILSGLAVLGIPLLLWKFFQTKNNKKINYAYISARFIEGVLMLMGAIMILNPSWEIYRNDMYEFIHVYFFLAGALFFYILLYRTEIVPRFISVWGVVATVLLFILIMLNLFGFESPFFGVLILPMILNELFLSVWLMVKGFDSEKIKRLKS